MQLKILFLSIFTLGLALTASAQGLSADSLSSITSAYRFYKDVDNIPINVPTVVEVPFSNEFIERANFAVLDRTTNSFEPYFFRRETLINEIPISVNANPVNSSARQMIDNNTRTYADFPLINDAKGHVQISLSSATPITSSALTILLEDNVALPNLIEIRAIVNGQNRIIVASRGMNTQTIRFLKTTSSNWSIDLTFGQPLRITELRLRQDNATKTNTRAIHFLAQPAHSYRIYFDPDRSVVVPVGEAGNLNPTEGLLILPASPSQNNLSYIIADTDKDGIPDIRDNCIFLANTDQEDVNNSGRGDVCEDFDGDGLINSIDNCPDNPNRNQRDTDSDGIGDVCDEEESRITERYPWIPWVGIGFAALVLVILLILTAKSTRITDQGNNL